MDIKVTVYMSKAMLHYQSSDIKGLTLKQK